MLCSWEKLPGFMKTKEVRVYYEILKKREISLFIKRIFDFVMASFMLLLLSPVFIVLAVLIKMDSKGPIFYQQERVTQYGRMFKIYKFRTMVQNADQIGSLVTIKGDTRITKVGKKLRVCRLDELPQLINIWKGEMTFVGTRPEVARYVKAYTSEMYATLLLPAGVTSEASVSFRNADELLNNSENADLIYIKEILPRKMKLNLRDVKYFSLVNEWKIMLKTVMTVMGIL